MNKLHQYVFEVDKAASRSLVKQAVEKIFDVEVLRVNILNAPAKRTRRARSHQLKIRKSGFKKAIVTLSLKDRIPFFEGVE